jgi:hypothetical protein
VQTSQRGGDYAQIYFLSTDASKQPPITTSSSPKIDPLSLYQLLNNDQNNVLVLDTRSKKEYESSRINYSCCINIPDDLLKTRYVSNDSARGLVSGCEVI